MILGNATRFGRHAGAFAAALACTLLVPVPARASFWELRHTICATDLEHVELRSLPLPVGCELAGCCTGCAAAGTIDWHVEVRGDALATAEVRFEAGTAALPPSFVADGDAVLVGANTVRVGKRGAVLRGLPYGGGVKPAVATIHVDVEDPRAASEAGTVLAAADSEASTPSAEESAKNAPSQDEPGEADAARVDPAQAEPAAADAPAEASDDGADENGADVDAGAGEVRLADALSAIEPLPGILARVEIAIEQRIGGITVGRAVLDYRIADCPSPVPRTDRIKLIGNRGRDSAVVVVDGMRPWGCTNDEIWRGKDFVYVRNLLDAGDCNEEVVVFSHDDAVAIAGRPLRAPAEPVAAPTDDLADALAAGVPELAAVFRASPEPVAEAAHDLMRVGWTAHSGDRLDVTLGDGRLGMPVVVWLAGGEPRRSVLRDRAGNDIAFADMVLNESRCGISVARSTLFMPPLEDETALAVALSLAAAAQAAACQLARGLSRRYEGELYAAGAVNVYYVDAPLGGRYCAGSDVVVIGNLGLPHTLLHHLGHVMQLGHVSGTGDGVDYDSDGAADFPTSNIMWASGAARDSFSEGQCFRMHIERDSFINRSGLRSGSLVRRCPDAAVAPQCLPVQLDVWPD